MPSVNRRDAQRFALLYQAGQELGRITAFAQLEQAYEIILRIAEEFGQCQMVISRYNEDSRELVMAHTSAFPSSFLFHQENLDVVINGQVIREPQTIVIHDTRGLPADVVVTPSMAGKSP